MDPPVSTHAPLLKQPAFGSPSKDVQDVVFETDAHSSAPMLVCCGQSAR